MADVLQCGAVVVEFELAYLPGAQRDILTCCWVEDLGMDFSDGCKAFNCHAK